MNYDLFYISTRTVNLNSWKKFKNKHPTAKLLENVSNFDQIKRKSFTKFFWIVWDDVVVADDFNFEYIIPKWDEQYVHVFLNEKNYDGIALIPKTAEITKREFEYRFYNNSKQIEVIASYPKPYDRFVVKTYNDYLAARENTTTDMFWIGWDDVELLDETVFNFTIDRNNVYELNQNHIFKNAINDETSYIGGVILASKLKVISKKEFDNRYLLEKKEHNRTVSRSRYPRYVIKNYDEYLTIQDTVNQSMFWYIPSDVEVIDETVFDLYFPLTDGRYDYDRKISHVFLNDSEYTGIVLFPTENPISKKEFDSRHIIERKEWNREVSRSVPYERFVIDTYEDYLSAKENSLTEMFWIIPKEVDVLDFNFDLRIAYSDSYNKKINHVFHHKFRDELTYNGIFLTNINLTLSKKEIEYRTPVNRKEHAILASKMSPYDIIFISYDESNADDHYQQLLKRFPRAKRVHGVRGIHQAHIEAAKLADTDMFWVVDADAVILDDFNFDYEVSRYDRHTVHVWSSRNPINDLVYGYGGVKLLPTDLTLNIDVESTDMTTSISSKFKAMPEISNITAFNTDPFSTWKSAFRECVKLASQIIDRQESEETEQRLTVWTSEGVDNRYGEYAIQGAQAGRDYGYKYKTNLDHLRKINDFGWLRDYFIEHTNLKMDI
jgi:hypothetical protein